VLKLVVNNMNDFTLGLWTGALIASVGWFTLIAIATT